MSRLGAWVLVAGLAAWALVAGVAATAYAQPRRVEISGRLDFDQDRSPYRFSLELPAGWHRYQPEGKQIYEAAFRPNDENDDAWLEIRVAVLQPGAFAKLSPEALAARLARDEIDNNVGADCGDCVPYEKKAEAVRAAGGPATLLRASGSLDGNRRVWRTLIASDGKRAWTVIYSRALIRTKKLESEIRATLLSFAI